jgi:hypothetical protein
VRRSIQARIGSGVVVQQAECGEYLGDPRAGGVPGRSCADLGERDALAGDVAVQDHRQAVEHQPDR